MLRRLPPHDIASLHLDVGALRDPIGAGSAVSQTAHDHDRSHKSLSSAPQRRLKHARCRNPLPEKGQVRVRMRVHAGLHTLLFAAARCSARTPDLQALQFVSARCRLFGRTFNPKVAGSIPARPIRFAGTFVASCSAADSRVRTSRRTRGAESVQHAAVSCGVSRLVATRFSLCNGILRPLESSSLVRSHRPLRMPGLATDHEPAPPRSCAPRFRRALQHP